MHVGQKTMRALRRLSKNVGTKTQLWTGCLIWHLGQESRFHIIRKPAAYPERLHMLQYAARNELNNLRVIGAVTDLLTDFWAVTRSIIVNVPSRSRRQGASLAMPLERPSQAPQATTHHVLSFALPVRLRHITNAISYCAQDG